MNSWRQTLVAPTASINDAIRIIDASNKQICLVADGDDRLLGTLTDGDIRRAILRAVALDAPVTQAMNPRPRTGAPGESRDSLLATMQALLIRQIPLVDNDGKVVGLAVLDDLLRGPADTGNWVVLMAGGLGTRLRPLTEETPKPLLKVGSKPIVETIIETIVRQGFRRFYVSVNYLGDKIKNHLGDGSRWGIDIRYLDEDEPLGTAGPLSLLPEAPDRPVFVMNADLLTKVNLRHILDFHQEHRALATIAVRQYDFQVPYGVVRLENHRVTAIDEKPVHNFLVNAGIYLLEPQVLAMVPRGQALDMPDLFRRLVADGHMTAAFPLREYWLDIGQMNDFRQANRDYDDEFPDP